MCREAGACVLKDRKLRELNLKGLSGKDNRKLEVVDDNLILWHGAELGVDIILVSPVCRDGTAYPRAAAEDEIRLKAARKRKEAKYAELLNIRRCKPVVIAMKIDERWSEEA